MTRSSVAPFFEAGSRKSCQHESGAIFQVRWSGTASGARPRHVRVRMVSRFSALQTKGRAKYYNLWRQMREFSNFVSEWCGDVVTARAYRVAGRGDRVRGDVVTARFTRGPRPVHA